MKKYNIFILLFLACPLFLCGCGGAAETQAPAETRSYTTHESPFLHASASDILDAAAEAAALKDAPLPAAAVVPEADASGELEERSEEAVIDYSHTSDGYVMVQYLAETDTRLKVLVKGPETTYSYNLPQGEWTVFPLSDGNGSYQIGVYKNISGSKYATVISATCDVLLHDEFAPFLRPNQYVNYTADSETVAKAMELTAGVDDPLEKVAVVYDFVVTNLSYDYEKAATVKSGYLPVLDQVLAEKKGICFDYAALMTAMLRSQEIPCKLVVGFAGETYHAWISVWTEENGWIDGAIFFDGQVWKRMDPTFASSGDGSDEIMDFIEHGSYTTKYLY